MMEWRPWQHVLLGIVLGMLVISGVFWVVSQPRGTPLLLEALPTPAQLQVHVAGAVKNPGLYALPPGSRVADAVERAGGLAADANPDAVNLASILRDGQQVYAARIGEEEAVAQPPLQSERQGLLDLNSATLEELMTLPGIGPTRAQDILDYRNLAGKFKQIDELMEIPGIGQATFDSLKPLVTITP
jgi:competence protein ComEA